MGTGKMLVKIPETIRIVLTGKKPDYIAGKDVILRVIGDLGTGGATYCALEFTGPGCASLSIEDRMTICNMAVEAGAKNGIFAADDKALAYVRARTKKPFEPLVGDPDAPVKAEYTSTVARSRSTPSSSPPRSRSPRRSARARSAARPGSASSPRPAASPSPRPAAPRASAARWTPSAAPTETRS